MRGNPADKPNLDVRAGSIPACAGEPSLRCRRQPFHRVYPRVCGGTAPVSPSLSVRNGLSPRVRGNRSSGDALRAAERSIPACAGEPDPEPHSVGADRVYPRVCGGTLLRDDVAYPLQGLSPRVRGNRFLLAARERRLRSIPACAGEPPRRPRTSSRGTVYPRVCGGTSTRWQLAAAVMGLSPRVRGNPVRDAIRQPQSGSIPACAGEPACNIAGPLLLQVYPRVCGGTSAM